MAQLHSRDVISKIRWRKQLAQIGAEASVAEMLAYANPALL
jgi:hypothetical protein